MNTERIDIRVSHEEKEMIRYEAEKKKKTISEYIMMCVAQQYNAENETSIFPSNYGRRR